jgi:hypothetical protein
MKTKVLCLILVTLILSNFLNVFARENYSKQEISDMDDEILFKEYRKLYLSGAKDCNLSHNNPLYKELSRRFYDHSSCKIELLALSEIEFKKNWFEEKKACKFQTQFQIFLRRSKCLETYNEMTTMLDRGNVLKDYYTSRDLIRCLTLNNYTKAVLVLEKIAYGEDFKYEHRLQREALIALAMIGKPGSDVLIERFEEWENSFDIREKGMKIGILWPLGHSKDTRALDIAHRYLDSDIRSMKHQALLVLAGLGSKRKQTIEKREHKWLYIPYELPITGADLSETERKKIKDILIKSLNDDNDRIRLVAARYLKYYPFPDVPEQLEKSMINDPYISVQLNSDDIFPVRDEAKESIENLKKHYPKLFKSLKKHKIPDMK